MLEQKTVLLLTDFSYQAKGREYFREDVELSCYLRKFFKVFIGHINDVEKVINNVDAILVRNTGPQATHCESLNALRKRSDLLVFNDLLGKGDINGKYHLLELFHSGFPVIPTYQSVIEVQKFGTDACYLIKPLNGADSHGVKILNYDELGYEVCQNVLIQPLVQFQYEVSFYFIGKQFYYSLYGPNPQKRWELQPYNASEKDVEFAQKFINWNTCKIGIQRVDACRTLDGKLLLMELEDYNPFLSLDLLSQRVKEEFLEALCVSLKEQISKKVKKISHV